ncbi:MAG TPA: YdcF family protein [Kofleriaceae bacterium]|nr:YdcF family protein [Kofleriaceae bacterium]
MSLTRLASLLERPLVVREALAPCDAIVVLGAPLAPGDRLSTVLDERVRAAAELFARGGAPVVVVTGGQTRGAGRAEAAVMAEALVARGVPAAAITVEDRALSTIDNARFVRALVGDRVRSVWLVTQPFHGRRARRVFRAAGFDAHVWHIADSVQYRDRRRTLRWLVREYASWIALLARRRDRQLDR